MTCLVLDNSFVFLGSRFVVLGGSYVVPDTGVAATDASNVSPDSSFLGGVPWAPGPQNKIFDGSLWDFIYKNFSGDSQKRSKNYQNTVPGIVFWKVLKGFVIKMGRGVLAVAGESGGRTFLIPKPFKNILKKLRGWVLKVLRPLWELLESFYKILNSLWIVYRMFLSLGHQFCCLGVKGNMLVFDGFIFFFESISFCQMVLEGLLWNMLVFH